MTTRVEHSDMLQAIPRLVAEGVVCDAVVTDPPYGLGFMGVAWDTMPVGRGRTNLVRDPSVKWDGDKGGDVAFRPETWATVATILRPGAFLVAFGGTRTYHRLACAIEDGGFVIQDCIMWLFATGFPKNKTQLKPAYEPAILAYKPGGKRTMQIDECRIGTEIVKTMAKGPADSCFVNLGATGFKGTAESEHTGRWPANVCHSGEGEVLAAFAAYGDAGGGFGKRGGGGHFGSYDTGTMETVGYGDSGSAARFFMSAKAGAQDRWGSKHPTVKPVELMKWLVALVTPPDGLVLDPFAGSGTTGVAALATGRNAILIEREAAYHADILERMAHYEGGGRHSLASKGRQARPRGEVPLFDRPYDEDVDAHDSYLEAVRAVGAKVKSGAPVPAFFLSDKPEAAE